MVVIGNSEFKKYLNKVAKTHSSSALLVSTFYSK